MNIRTKILYIYKSTLARSTLTRINFKLLNFINPVRPMSTLKRLSPKQFLCKFDCSLKNVCHGYGRKVAFSNSSGIVSLYGLKWSYE